MSFITLNAMTRLYRTPSEDGTTSHAGVRDISASIDRGSFALLKGVSGSGKSTLVQVVSIRKLFCFRMLKLAVFNPETSNFFFWQETQAIMRRRIVIR